jgi:ribosomal protein L11 methyltransferase
VVKPPWVKICLKKGQVSIDIIPGMAFGTGTHATTILCIQALVERFPKRGATVLDVGMGSGILSILSSKLGAREVWGVDVDKVALENARENIEQNHVGETVKIIKGGMGGLRKKFDVVVANIDLNNLKRMNRSLPNRLKRHGLLILSGILEREEETIRDHYLKRGLLRWLKTARREEWVCLMFERK